MQGAGGSRASDARVAMALGLRTRDLRGAGPRARGPSGLGARGLTGSDAAAWAYGAQGRSTAPAGGGGAPVMAEGGETGAVPAGAGQVVGGPPPVDAVDGADEVPRPLLADAGVEDGAHVGRDDPGRAPGHAHGAHGARQGRLLGRRVGGRTILPALPRRGRGRQRPGRPAHGARGAR